MKFKAILIDDEEPALSRLKRLLKPYADVIEAVDTAMDGAEAIEKINFHKPDLIFLDIQMPEYSGFEVLERVNHFPFVIFLTAYDEYALKAFETNSIDYLLKPVEPGRFKKAVDKLTNITSGGLNNFSEKLSEVIKGFKASSLKRLTVKTGDRFKLLSPGEIFYFKALDKYVEVNTFEKSYLITKTLSQLEDELPGESFARVHRSYIVNLNCINEIVKMFGGSYKIKLKNKEKDEIPVSRGYKERLSI